MSRFLVIVCLLIAGSMFAVWPSMALDQDVSEIRSTARDIRLQVSELDKQLKEHLRKALEEYGNRAVECSDDQPRATLSECVEADANSLIKTTITIARAGDNEDDLTGDLADTEERYALFTQQMNKTNDLLARAGARLYLSGLDVAPEMDQLRHNVIAYIELKQANELRTKQALLIATVAIILIAIFSLIFAVIQRFR
ncbi:hypothetical protein ACTU44_18985 [Thalassospira sp. SM2505]|uniref:hypothetical protein n=1 Tax=Thalassospira sp. CH_XMU1448-2 TaxID=3107773 RepID=UPI003008847C